MDWSDYVLLGLMAHVVGDWILQNDWMAKNKHKLLHPAAFVHSTIHYVLLLLVYDTYVAALVAGLHLLIDLRVHLQWWRSAFRQTTEGPAALHVAIWQDQIVHFLILAAASWLQLQI